MAQQQQAWPLPPQPTPLPSKLGTPSHSASQVATGPSTPATATTVACKFSLSSWAAAGGTGNPAAASKAEQIRVAENLLQMQGWGAWPSCAAKLNLYAYGTSGAAATVAEAPAATTTTVAPQATQVTEVAAAPAVVETPAVVEAPTAETAPAAEVVAEAAPAANTYTVKAGDTLSEIAYAHGFNGWDEVLAANADLIQDADVIEIGWVLTIPAK